MRFPWVNLALLGLLIIQTVTGYFGFTNGREPRAWLLWLHGIGAYSLLILMFFKAGVIVSAWQRKTRWTWRRIAFVVLLVLLALTTLSGIIWTFNGPVYLAGFSLISLHMYLAIPLMVLMLWHSWSLRFIRNVKEARGRRLFLAGALATLSGVLLWRTADRVKAWLGMPGSDRRFTGSYEIGSFSPEFPVVSWISDRPPIIDPAAWSLRIEGLVDTPLKLTYDDLLTMRLATLMTELDCTGGWYTTQRWQGIPVGELLDRARPIPGALSVTFESATGYKRRFPLAAARDYLLALGTIQDDGLKKTLPLSSGHGFPARLVAPDKRGMEWVKWVTIIRVNESPAVQQSPLPLQ